MSLPNHPEQKPSELDAAGSSLLSSWRDWSPLYATTASLLSAAAAWYLLKELGPLLRPLVLAILLSYAILPLYGWLKRHMSTTLAVILLATITGASLYGLAWLVFSNVVHLNAELPRLTDRAQALAEKVRTELDHRLPEWLAPSKGSSLLTEADAVQRLNRAARSVADAAVGALGEAVLVGFYMLFLLLEVHLFPSRIREGFSSKRATELLQIVQSINRKIVDYLRVKAVASLCLAVPHTLILWSMGVKFSVMWGLLAFVGNFIPYLGSFVAVSLPVALAFLDFESTGRAAIVTVLLVANQFVNNNLIEPVMTARAVGLSPLIVLISLSFWGLSWGLVGMLLAVPLTVVLKIVWENIPITRGLARMMDEK